MRVFVYWNLHRKTWSIKALEGPDKGLVIGHADSVLLRNATPRVSEKGRQRVLRERKKNVHAGIVGTLGDPSGITRDLCPTGITYNPYKYSTFMYRWNNGETSPFEYRGSAFALLDKGKVYVSSSI